MKSKKTKIGITGNIGSGKTEFCKYIAGKGYPVIEADELAKNILASDKEVQAEVIKAFGPESFSNGAPDKKFLAETVFSDPEKVVLINSIIHPAVIAEIEKRIEELFVSNDKVFVEAALLFEAEMEEMFDLIVLIAADKEKRFARKSKQLDLADIEKRDNNQILESEKKGASDFTFQNDGTLEELFAKAELLLKLI
ncbi:MAG: dephospho-CoA kinase [Bacteroidota bacterium]|nr:dephospho-CoA kinase [Bacteroidota bacterium]